MYSALSNHIIITQVGTYKFGIYKFKCCSRSNANIIFNSSNIIHKRRNIVPTICDIYKSGSRYRAQDIKWPLQTTVVTQCIVICIAVFFSYIPTHFSVYFSNFSNWNAGHCIHFFTLIFIQFLSRKTNKVVFSDVVEAKTILIWRCTI